MPEVIITPSPVNGGESTSNAPSVEVFAVYGVEPEVQAYAMAKYSRSALSMKESLQEINQQKAEPQNADFAAAIPRTEALVIDEETRKAAQADRDGTLAQARAAMARDPSKRAAIIERLRQLGIAF